MRFPQREFFSPAEQSNCAVVTLAKLSNIVVHDIEKENGNRDHNNEVSEQTKVQENQQHGKKDPGLSKS